MGLTYKTPINDITNNDVVIELTGVVAEGL